MGKALKTVGMVIGAAALVATGAGAVLMPGLAGGVTLFGVSTGTLNLISAGMAAVGGLLDKPQSTGSASPTDWTSNPDQPTPFAFGRVGVSGKIIHRDEYGPDNRLQGIVSVYSGAGPIQGYVSYSADDAAVSFVSNGGTAIGKYNRQMWRSWRLGDQPDTALSLPTGLDGGAVMPAWGSAYKLSGKACDLLTVQQDSKFTVYPTGVPTPLVVLDGVKGYDPRYDDTYPGGSGACRLGVRSTYRFIENPIIGGLNWALGMVENGQVVGGIGASINGIDVPAFVEAANIADANGWKVTAWPDTSEDVSTVLKQFLQAGGAAYARHAGKISCVSRGAARASVVTITARDTTGPLELDTGSSQFNRLNTITPEFMSPASWKHVPADPVSFAALRTEDGGKKADSIRYRFVPDVTQAAQLAAYDILDAREPFSGTIPLKPHLRRLKRGDCFVIDESGFLLDGVKCMVLSRTYDAQTGEVRLAFRSETDGKHDLALGKTTTMPTYPGLTPVDPTLVNPPNPLDWTVIVRPAPPEGGGQVPGLVLQGVVNNATAHRVLVETGPSETGPWTQAYFGPPTAETIEITLDANTTYFVAVSYFNAAGNQSARTVYGPYTTNPLVADDVIVPGGRRISELFPEGTDLETITEDARTTAANLILETAQRWIRTHDEKLAAISREDRIEQDLVFTRTTLVAANEAALALIDAVDEAAVTRDAAQTTQRVAAVSTLNGSIATVQSQVNTQATALAAETSTRETQYSATASTLAAYDGLITTAVSQSSANASAITSLGVSLSTASGLITTLQSAQATLDGKVNLLYGFALNSNGRIAGMYAANDGSTSVIDFEFDVFRIWSGSASVPMFAVDSGNVYIAGNRVNTNSIVNGAVTNGGSSRTTGAVICTSATLVQNCALTTAGGRVRVDFSVNLFGGSSTPADVTGYVYRNGSLVWTGTVGQMTGVQRVFVGPTPGIDDYVDIPGALSAPASLFFIDTGASAGSNDYHLYIGCPASVSVSERNMALLELKR